MKGLGAKLSLGAGRPSGSWLMLLLLLAALVPSVCLLWFMNQAVRNERLAVREKLAEAYRANLAVMQNQLEATGARPRTRSTPKPTRLSPPALFARQVRSGLADAVICFDAAGNVTYPATDLRPRPEALEAVLDPSGRHWSRATPRKPAAAFARLAGQTTNANVAARALQAQARCLVKATNTKAAIALLTGPLEEERYRHATDAQGRLLVPNAELMALELLKDSAPDRARTTLERLRRACSITKTGPCPPHNGASSCASCSGSSPIQRCRPMLAAEDLAARWLEAGPARPGEPAFRPTALPDVWQFTSSQGGW